MNSEVLMVRMALWSIFSLCVGIQSGSAPAQSHKRLYVGDGDRAWLGVSVQDVTGRNIRERHLSAKEGALVTEVVEDSPAEEAGIREGDVIVRFDDRRIEDSDDLIGAVRRTDTDEKVEIVVDRKGESKTLTATLDRTRNGRSFTFRVPPVPETAPEPDFPFHVKIRGREKPAGLRMQELGKQLGEYFEVPGKRGVLVTSVDPNSAGEKAGVMAGDVITRVNGNTVRDVADCLDEFRDTDGDEVRLDMIRRGKQVGVTVTLEPSDRLSGEYYFRDGTARLRDELRELKKDLPAGREALRELRDHLREMKEHLHEDIGYDLRESLRENFRDLRELGDGLRETIHEQLPLLRRVARAAFLSI